MRFLVYFRLMDFWFISRRRWPDDVLSCFICLLICSFYLFCCLSLFWILDLILYWHHSFFLAQILRWFISVIFEKYVIQELLHVDFLLDGWLSSQNVDWAAMLVLHLFKHSNVVTFKATRGKNRWRWRRFKLLCEHYNYTYFNFIYQIPIVDKSRNV